ncbi:MAG: hypothetical protein HY863_15780 [Chloroflexi bacterium]|nr:hypothetical protein [Chloroflexota bacterium]
MAEGISAHGTLIKMGDGATPTETFATIATVGDIDGPTIKNIMEDFTNHGSGGKVKKKPILQDGDKLKFPVDFISSDPTHNKTTGLVAAAQNKTEKHFQVIFPDSSGFAITAYVEEVKFKAPVKGKLSADITLDVNDITNL